MPYQPLAVPFSSAEAPIFDGLVRCIQAYPADAEMIAFRQTLDENPLGLNKPTLLGLFCLASARADLLATLAQRENGVADAEFAAEVAADLAALSVAVGGGAWVGAKYATARADGVTGTGAITNPFDISTPAKLSAMPALAGVGATIVVARGTFNFSGSIVLLEGQLLVGAGIGLTVFFRVANDSTGLEADHLTNPRPCVWTGFVEHVRCGAEGFTVDNNLANQPVYTTPGRTGYVGGAGINAKHGTLRNIEIIGTFSNPGEAFPVSIVTSGAYSEADPATALIENVIYRNNHGYSSAITIFNQSNIWYADAGAVFTNGSPIVTGVIWNGPAIPGSILHAPGITNQDLGSYLLVSLVGTTLTMSRNAVASGVSTGPAGATPLVAQNYLGQNVIGQIRNCKVINDTQLGSNCYGIGGCIKGEIIDCYAYNVGTFSVMDTHRVHNLTIRNPVGKNISAAGYLINGNNWGQYRNLQILNSWTKCDPDFALTMQHFNLALRDCVDLLIDRPRLDSGATILPQAYFAFNVVGAGGLIRDAILTPNLRVDTQQFPTKGIRLRNTLDTAGLPIQDANVNYGGQSRGNRYGAFEIPLSTTPIYVLGTVSQYHGETFRLLVHWQGSNVAGQTMLYECAFRMGSSSNYIVRELLNTSGQADPWLVIKSLGGGVYLLGLKPHGAVANETFMSFEYEGVALGATADDGSGATLVVVT